jgi:hypothetical protein
MSLSNLQLLDLLNLGRGPGDGIQTSTEKGLDLRENWNPNYREIVYNHNEHGFRCDSFLAESQLPILFLGCSFTEGIGLNLEDVWSYRLLEKIKEYKNINIPYWSLAAGGASIDLQTLYLHTFIDQLKPKYIFFLLPPLERRFIRAFEKSIFFSSRGVSNHHTSIVGDPLTSTQSEIIRQAKELLLDPDYSMLESVKSLLLINELCKRYQTKVFYSTWTNNIEATASFKIFEVNEQLNNLTRLKCEFPSVVDKARDNSHAGPITNNRFSEHVFEEVKDLL